MKRSTAIRHLVEMSEAATADLRLRDTSIEWPLEELWAAGDLLTAAETFDRGAVAVVLDLPPEELPWLALHPTAEWIGSRLRLGKRPLRWCYRPLVLPVGNHEYRRLVRFWSAREGMDQIVIDALQSRQFEGLAITESPPDRLAEQLREELGVSRRHLREVLDHYWDDKWRRAHTGREESTEDHLWRAAMAVSEMQDALHELESR